MEDRETELPATGEKVERGLVSDVIVPVAGAVGLGAAGGFGMKAGADAYDAVKTALTPKPQAESPVILPPGADQE